MSHAWPGLLGALVHQRTGIEVPVPAPQLEALAKQRVRALGLGDPDAYLMHLRGLSLEDAEWAQLVAAATNSLTHFFRDPEQLAALVQVLAFRANGRAAANPLRIWCAGCSTGEEAYSVAILCWMNGISAEVWGSDVNRQSLEQASDGVYHAWSLRHVDREVKTQVFETVSEGMYKIRPWIAAKVRFHEHNLVRDDPLSPPAGRGWDVILCRNVLIYYSQQAIKQMLTEFARVLAPGGALMLGASESVLSLDVPLRLETVAGRVVYYHEEVASTRRPSLREHQGPPSSITPSLPCSLPSRTPHSRPGLGRTSVPVSAATAEQFGQSYINAQPAILAWVTEGDFTRAIECLQRVIKDNPLDPLAHLSLAHLHLIEHRLDEAKALYDEVSSTEPLLAETHFFLGILERKRRRFEQALVAFRRAVFLQPTFWEAAFLLGATARRLGKHEVCRTEWRRTAVLLQTGQGGSPFVTHPLFHASFLHSPDRVLGVCSMSAAG